MKLCVNYPTNRYFENGELEIGKVNEIEVITRIDLENALDEVQDGVDYFITVDGEKVDVADVYAELD